MRVGLFDPETRIERDLHEHEADVPDLIRLESVQDAVEHRSDLEYVVAVGEPALLSVFRTAMNAPLIPVAVDAGLPSVSEDQLDTALESLANGDVESVEMPTIDVSLGESEFRALMDVMAVTAEPARISEFRTKKGDGTVVDTVRADGVVVSAPAGTPGYGTAVDGPILDPAVGGVAVVPVGQFRTAHPRWVLAPPVEIEVIRDTVPISLVVDDREVETMPADTSLRLTWGRPVEFGVLEHSKRSLGEKRSTLTR